MGLRSIFAAAAMVGERPSAPLWGHAPLDASARRQADEEARIRRSL